MRRGHLDTATVGKEFHWRIQLGGPGSRSVGIGIFGLTDRLAESSASGDFNGHGYDDLAVGTPRGQVEEHQRAVFGIPVKVSDDSAVFYFFETSNWELWI